MIDEIVLGDALIAYQHALLGPYGNPLEAMRAAAKVIEDRVRAEDIEIVLALRAMPIPKTKQKTMAREFAIAIVEGIARAVEARQAGVPL